MKCKHELLNKVIKQCPKCCEYVGFYHKEECADKIKELEFRADYHEKRADSVERDLEILVNICEQSTLDKAREIKAKGGE